MTTATRPEGAVTATAVPSAPPYWTERLAGEDTAGWVRRLAVRYVTRHPHPAAVLTRLAAIESEDDMHRRIT